MPLTGTRNISLTIPLIDTSDVNPQKQSILFGRVPGETRNQIFDLAFTAYPGKQKPFEKSAYYCRPGFRYADLKIDTALLRTCRRVYQEARFIPRQNYVHVEWFTIHRNFRPSEVEGRGYCRKVLHCASICPWVTSLHLFISQVELESGGIAVFRDCYPDTVNFVRNLKLTIRHCDWSCWPYDAPLVLDAKEDQVLWSACDREPTDGSDRMYLDCQLSMFKRLKTFELEVESIEARRKELDRIFDPAQTWRFPLDDGNVLALNRARTKKAGWLGARKRKCFPSALLKRFVMPLIEITGNEQEPPSDPIKAKERLIKDGIDFIAWDGEPEILDEDHCMTYYVISLCYEAQKTQSA